MTFKKVQESKEIGKEIVEGQEVAIYTVNRKHYTT